MALSPKARRITSCFLLIVMLTNLVFPTVSYALTSGPTSPEATSFEPVDTTDMVNLQTGDFTYNIPLIEVPGPEGGYPLSLSYHAGIQPNEDASWVGLGWTLNPGAINRSVNGYPDDWYNPTGTTRQYWEGGVQKTYSVGLSVGIANTPASANFDLSFSNDTYQGFGAGLSVGIGGNIGPLNASISVGNSPYGDSYTTGNIGISDKYRIASAGIGFSTGANFEKLSVGYHASLLGVSMETSKGQTTFGFRGMSSSVTSSKEAGIQTKTKSVGMSIPTPIPGLSVSLQYSKTRYWTDETTNVTTHGSLYSSGWSVIDNRAYDTYSLLEDPSYKSIVDYPDPTQVQGGAYLDFDSYDVVAQGLGGSMRPYLFQGEVLGQNRKDQNNNPINTYFSPGATNATPIFRFAGDFSNSYRQSYPNYPDPSLNLRESGVPPPFDSNPLYGNSDGGFGYIGGNALAGSRHIDIGVKIQPINTRGYVKTQRYKSGMIDGFSITNESGVTYHYGLPAYTYGEEIYQENIYHTTADGGYKFNRQSKGEAYAYTWYLTAITGPDYVDRGATGLSSEDWGYWVSFEYGKWADDYVWRNPSEGYHRDEDNEFQNCSMGHKEIYYLNAIRTRSHIAWFEKEVRMDGRGAAPEIFNTDNGKNYINEGIFNYNSCKSLSLSKIYLLNSSEPDAAMGFNNSGNNNGLLGNVLDNYDTYGTLAAKSIRVIDFNYDYSLCPGTASSENAYGTNKKVGKLTLKSIVNKGKGGVNLLPPTTFDYDLPSENRKEAAGTFDGAGVFHSSNSSLELGDLLKTNDPAQTYLGAIYYKNYNPTTNNYSYYLSIPAYNVSVGVVTTKNPAYDGNGYDQWNCFKAVVNNSDIGRATSELSSRNVDVWSLRKVSTPLGNNLKIDYESDDYSQSVVKNNRSFGFNTSTYGLEPLDDQNYTLEVNLGIAPYLGFSLNDFFEIGKTVDLVGMVNYTSGNTDLIKVVDTRDGEYTFTITSMNDVSNSIKLSYNKSLSGVRLNGNIFPNKIRSLTKGGGIRVKEIQVINDDIAVSTKYNYSTGSKSSGVVSYEPNGFEPAMRLVYTPYQQGYPYYSSSYIEQKNKEYARKLYRNKNYLLTIVRELPPPGVVYEYVKVTNEVKNVNEMSARETEGSTQYQFEVLRENMVGRVEVNNNGPNSSRTDFTTSWGHFTTHNLAIKKFTSCIGNTKRITQYDNNGKKLSETINHYLHDGLENLTVDQFMEQYKGRLSQYNYQGYLQERTSEVKGVHDNGWSPSSNVMATLSAREEYPCISTGQTVINYINGTRTKTENIAYDFYSGVVTKSVETDAYGNRYMTEVIPAYRQYSSMGLKLSNSDNKNMLTQTAGSLMYKVDAANYKLGLVSATANTWSNAVPVLDPDGSLTQYAQSNIWRPQSSYTWLPDGKTADGLTAMNNFSPFNYNSPSSFNASWKKTSEFTLYDVYSKSLEAKDVNGNYAATHMGYNNSKVAVSGSSAKYYEIAFSGAEDENIEKAADGFIGKGDGSAVSPSTQYVHTGSKSLSLGAGGQKGFIYTVSTDKLTANRDYIASVWVKSPAGSSPLDVKLYYDINGVIKSSSISSVNSGFISDGWKLITLKINGTDISGSNSDKISVWCRNDGAVGSYIDDMRFQPLQSSSTAYVYDNFSGELTYVLDNNNLYTKYEYDAVGRLRKVYKETLRNSGSKLMQEYSYNYGLAPKFGSDALTQDFNKQCPAGLYGTTVPVSVTAGQFLSNISKEDANIRRDAWIQNYVQQQGSCSTTPEVYARLEFVLNPTSSTLGSNSYGMSRDGSIWVKFYSDPQCTQPLTITQSISYNISITTIIEDEYGSFTPYYSSANYTSPPPPSGGYTGFKFGDDELPLSMYSLYYEWDENYNYTYYEKVQDYYTLNAYGSNYVVKPTSYSSCPYDNNCQ